MSPRCPCEHKAADEHLVKGYIVCLTGTSRRGTAGTGRQTLFVPGVPISSLAAPTGGRILSAGPPRILRFAVKLMY